MPDDDQLWRDDAVFEEWLSKESPIGRFVVENFLQRRLVPRDEHEWLEATRAVTLIIQVTGYSTGAAVALLRKACLSEEVRSRGRRGAPYNDVRSLSADDWRGTFQLSEGVLDVGDPNRAIFDVKIHAEDLNWWIQNRWTVGIGYALPGVERKLEDRLLERNAAEPLEQRKRGRPQKGKDLYLAEFKRRRHNNSCLPTVPEEAIQLAKWLKENHPGVEQANLKTIKNSLWKLRVYPLTPD